MPSRDAWRARQATLRSQTQGDSVKAVKRADVVSASNDPPNLQEDSSVADKPITTDNRQGDAVNNPRHYNTHPSGVECIEIVEHMGFNLGNAVSYIWRCDDKGNWREDLAKAIWYVQREILKRTQDAARSQTVGGAAVAPVVPATPPIPELPTMDDWRKESHNG